MEEQKPPFKDSSQIDPVNPQPQTPENQAVPVADAGASKAPTTGTPGQSPTPLESPNTSPVVVVSDPAYASTKAQKKMSMKLLMIVGMGAIVVVALIVAALLLTKKTKPPVASTSTQNQQLTSEQSPEKSEAKSMIDDISTIAGDITNPNSPSTLSAELAQDSQIKSDLTDAQSQYVKLESSSVKAGSTLSIGLSSLKTKWTPYDQFVTEYVVDDEAVSPIIFPFFASAQSLSQQAPTNASQTSIFLDSYKSLIATTLTKLEALKLNLTANQSAASAVEAYLNSSTSSINAAESAIQAGNDSAALVDIQQLNGASQTTMQNALTAAENAMNSQEQQLNPTATITAVENAS